MSSAGTPPVPIGYAGRLAPREHAALALLRVREILRQLGEEDRAYLVPLLASLLREARDGR